MSSQQLSDGNNAYVKTILVLAANPKSTSSLRLDEEVREIDEGLRRASRREQFRLEQKWAVSMPRGRNRGYSSHRHPC